MHSQIEKCLNFFFSYQKRLFHERVNLLQVFKLNNSWTHNFMVNVSSVLSKLKKCIYRVYVVIDLLGDELAVMVLFCSKGKDFFSPVVFISSFIIDII